MQATWRAGCQMAPLISWAAWTTRRAQLLVSICGIRVHAWARKRLKYAPKPACTAWRQVKLRGFRVELGEVEHALSEIPGVQLAVALVLQDPTGSHSLVAYVTPASLDAAQMASELKGRLPAHMVPSVIVPLERMPLLPNEKVDRRALPAPDWGTGVAEEYMAPANELETQIQTVWQEVLGQERISTHADFFAMGGNSLQVLLQALPDAARLTISNLIANFTSVDPCFIFCMAKD